MSYKALLQEVMDYLYGKGKYNFSRLPDDERSLASLEAWEELKTRMQLKLANKKGRK